MSNVKVNGNTYNGVTSVNLPLADGSGFATYAEGAVTDNVTNSILDGSISGNLTNEDITTIALNCFRKATVGVLNFPNAVKMQDNAEGVTAESILLPRVSSISSVPNFRSSKISGVLDLSALPNNIVGMNQTFSGATIGTLKLGEMGDHNGCLQNATITNLIWNYTKSTSINANDNGNIAGKQALGCIGLKVTNAYIPDALYDGVKALIDDGTITTVTNLYKISEWSDG